MELRVPVMSRKLWEMAKGFVLIIRKGILKRKLMFDLNLRFHRDKISGNPIPNIHLIMFRRRRHTAGNHNPGLEEEEESANDVVYVDPVPESDIQMFMSPAPAVELNYSGIPKAAAAAARQVRITDSPYAVVDGEEDDVDKAAEEFIARFYRENAKKARG